jgi:LacI family transcriptional regulator
MARSLAERELSLRAASGQPQNNPHRHRDVAAGKPGRHIAGAPARIAFSPPKEQAPRSNMVVRLSLWTWHEFVGYEVFFVSELRRYLHDVGFDLQVHTLPRLRRASRRVLTEFVQDSKAACWILSSVSADIQRWFSQSKLPTFVFGSCYPGIRLPSWDADHRAVCRHAVGVFLGLGHRQIALLLRKMGAGDVVTEQGFLEGFQLAPHRDSVPMVVTHDATVRGIRRAVDSLLRGRRLPTALLVSHARDALTVASHLTNLGVRLPGRMSLICRDRDWFLDSFVPRVARYEFNDAQVARRLARAVVQLATTGLLEPRPILIMPRLDRGETLGPSPERTG